MHLLVQPAAARLAGDVPIPPSKYHAHRALVLASLARGRTTIAPRTEATHVRFTVKALEALGTDVRTDGECWQVHGGPYRPVVEGTPATVAVGSSGSTLYFLLGLASLSERPVRFVGQKYMRRRPVGAMLEALRTLGIRVESKDGRLPVTVYPGRPRGGRVRIPGTLSQWISGLLLLSAFARETTVIEIDGELNERPYLELTLEMMSAFGLHASASDDWRRFEIPSQQEAVAADIRLTPDLGSAVFGIAACGLQPAEVTFHSHTSLERHPEHRVLEVLREFELPLRIVDGGHKIVVSHAGESLRPVRIDCRDIPDMLPVLSTLASRAGGRSSIENVEHIRLKESDRVASMLQLERMGACVRFEDGRLVFDGVDRLHGASLSSFNDHRVLMALTVAGAAAVDGTTTITYPHAYRMSYPEFLDHMQSIGLQASVEDTARIAVS